MLSLFSSAECRVGEAKTPGPQPPLSTWSLGVCNPSGLHGKSTLLSGIGSEIIAISETHLTAVSRSTVLSSLRAHGLYQHLVSGAPLAPRSVVSEVGTYSGVAVASTVPSRALCVDWPPDLYETGRAQVVGSYVGSVWVTGALAYGYPQSKTHANATQRTEAILDFLLHHMSAVAKGPRYLCGDWNLDYSHLKIARELHALGWRECQDLEFERTGRPPEMTCKMKTRKDFLWISPELVACFHSLDVQHDRFPDHSTLVAKFAMDSAHVTRYLWPVPTPVPWSQIPDALPAMDFSSGSPTELYKLWQAQENQAQQHLGPAWHANMAGRGQQTSPIKRQGWPVPLKKGRSIDMQPGFFGYNVQHSRWMRQLRRLHNYKQWAVTHWGQCSLQAWTHGLFLWKSILRAKGFGRSFQQWWTGRTVWGFHDLGSVPDFPPSVEVACSLCHTFEGEVRWFERQLRDAQRVTKTSAHERNPNLIFKDTRRAIPEPVTSLLHKTKAQVTAVDLEDLAVDFSPQLDFDDTRPVLLGSRPVSIIHATETRLYLAEVSKADVGSSLVQTTPVGSVDAIFEAFHEQWRARWCKHDGVPHSRWQQLVDFARAHLPTSTAPDLVITPQLLKAEVGRKKGHAATGLDGVSRRDLLQVSPTVLEGICSMFDRAQADGLWPSQVTSGRVASLAKVANPETPNEFRPITVFAMAYRAFSSLHARSLLEWADTWCHPDIYGNRKHCHTAQLWRSLVTQIQQAHDQNVPLSGLCADVEKCFNCLPRWLVLSVALHVGTPFSTLTAWAGAMSSMTRHFKVRDSLSPGFCTSTGLAEGCALSCFGMLLLDDLMHRYIAYQCSSLRTLSFVDNWDMLTWDPSAAVRQLDALLDFAALTDLTIDRKKTFAWSTCATVRAQLRLAGVPVQAFARDLGAHVAFTKQRTNRTATARLDSLDSLWPQLRASKACYRLKLKALRAVAWPRGLFGISSAPISSSVWWKHRRKATQALNFDKAGVNPLLLLGLVESSADPEQIALMQTVRDARMDCPLDFWSSELYPLAVGILASPASSPCAVLLSRLQSVGLSVLPDGRLLDMVGPFHPATVNHAELSLRLQLHWHQKVVTEVSHRRDFAGLGFADVLTTRSVLTSLSMDQQALMRLSLAGGLFTQDAHSHWNDGPGLCKWCDQPDSLQHRYFECVHTRDLRLRLAPDLCKVRHLVPDAMALRSWALLPPTHVQWLQLLDSIPAVSAPLAPLRGGAWNDVFTDGSCLWQSSAACRVAAWSAVLAQPFSNHWAFSCRGVLGSSWLPGLVQTAFRAELFALAFVLHHASCGGFPVRIFSDCLGVVSRFHLLTRGKMRLRQNKANNDLWQWILHSVDKLGIHAIQVHKVAAHKQLSDAKSRRDAWLYWNNGAADQVAKYTNVCRPTAFWTFWQQHSFAVQAAEVLHQQAYRLHLAVAERSVKAAQARTLDEEQVLPRTDTRQFDQQYDIEAWTGQTPNCLSLEYGMGMIQRLTTWWTERSTSMTAEPIRWISFTHLYLDWQMTWGCAGPIKHGGGWLDPCTRRYLEPERHPFLARVKWFRRMLKKIWQVTSQRIGMAQCRCWGEMIQSFVNSASIRWDTACLLQTENWLQHTLSEPCCRGTTALKSLPIARRNSGMALFRPMSKDIRSGSA